MTAIKRLVVLTSGGDAPGMNAGIRAVTRTAIAHGIQVFGCENGYEGLVKDELHELSKASVANCIQRGGTILKTSRYPEFKDAAVRQKAIANLHAREIDALVVLGGDGSFRGAALLAEEGDFKVMGIPCTIDNDILGTKYTIGFDTACNTALAAVDKIRDTAFSHSNNFLVEVMGRSSGFLATNVGIAGGAELILVPEIPLATSALIKRIESTPRLQSGSMIVVAEADCPGRSFKIADAIEEQLGLTYKVCVLGHTQRGGKPTTRDRRIASLMGYYAVQTLLNGENKRMIAYSEDDCKLVDFPEVNVSSRTVSNQQLFEINNVLCDL